MQGPGELQQVTTAAVEVNSDDSYATGYAPAQCVIERGRRKAMLMDHGRQPLWAGLSSASASREPRFERRLALQEAARVALACLHYSGRLHKVVGPGEAPAGGIEVCRGRHCLLLPRARGSAECRKPAPPFGCGDGTAQDS